MQTILPELPLWVVYRHSLLSALALKVRRPKYLHLQTGQCPAPNHPLQLKL